MSEDAFDEDSLPVAEAAQANNAARAVFQWPQQVAKAFSADAACRLHALLLAKVLVASDYSGYGSEIEALSCGCAALQKTHAWQFPAPPLVFKRVCDIGGIPQQVLTSLSQQRFGGRMCVFSDIVDHCHPQAAAYLRASVPDEESTQAAAEEAYQSMLAWLIRNRSWALSAECKQWCLVHKAMCSVCPAEGWIQNLQVLRQNMRKRKLPERDAESDKSNFDPGCSDAASESEPLAALPETTQTKPGMDRPWSISFAGVTCDGWSTMGSQARFGHASELPRNVWVVERLVRGEQSCEDVAFVECTSKYPAAEKLSPLLNSHKVLHFKCSPLQLGYPVSRPRVFAACLNLRTTVWVGPEDWQNDFMDKFGMDCVVAGDTLFVASDEERHLEYEQLAAQQKNFIPAKLFKDFSDDQCLSSMLTPGQQERVAKYVQCRSDHESPGGHLLFDADHHLHARRMAGPYWPCMLTHGSIISAPRNGQKRLATALEHFGAQGLHLFSASSADNAVSPLKPILQTLKIHQLKNLSGRGVHLGVLSAFMWYVLSNTIPLWQACPLRHSLSWDQAPESEES